MRASHLGSFAAALLLFATAASAFAQSGDASTPVPGQASAPAVPAHAGVSGLDAMTSTVFQEGQSSFSGLGLRLRLRSGALVPNVEILPAVEFWQNQSSVSVSGGVKTTRSDATLGCGVRWTFTKQHWQPYVGGGIAVHFLDDKVNAPQLGVNNQHNATVRGGYTLHGGVTFPMTKKLSNFIELEHHGVSHFRQLKFHTGLGWNF